LPAGAVIVWALSLFGLLVSFVVKRAAVGTAPLPVTEA
jgi:hypothetical protein